MRGRLISRTKKKLLLLVAGCVVLCLVGLLCWFRRDSLMRWAGMETIADAEQQIPQSPGSMDTSENRQEAADGSRQGASKEWQEAADGSRQGASEEWQEAADGSRQGTSEEWQEAAGENRQNRVGNQQDALVNQQDTFGRAQEVTDTTQQATAGSHNMDKGSLMNAGFADGYKNADHTAQMNLRELTTNQIHIIGSIQSEDIVDVRLRYPNGEDYVVLSHRSIQVQEEEPQNETTKFSLFLEEQEIIYLSSAIYEASRYIKSELYLVKYPEQYENSSTVTYLPNQAVLTMLRQNNLIDEEKQKFLSERRAELDNRLEQTEGTTDIVSGLEGYRLYE